MAAERVPDDGSEAPPTAAELVELSPEHLQARASGPGGLVFTDAYHRGWRAYLDGNGRCRVPLANYVGRGVGLPPGEHTVDLVFDPLSWRIGKAISFAAISFVLLVLLISFLTGSFTRWRRGTRSRTESPLAAASARARRGTNLLIELKLQSSFNRCARRDTYCLRVRLAASGPGRRVGRSMGAAIPSCQDERLPADVSTPYRRARSRAAYSSTTRPS